MSKITNKRLFKFTLFLIAFVIIAVCLSFGYKFYLETAYPIKYQEYVEKASKDYGIEPALIYSVIRAESKFDESAKSSAGAIGLMQIMPDTFEWINLKKKENIDGKDLKSPEVNIDCGTYLLSILFSRYKDFDVAIAAYNAGMGTVDKWLNDQQFSSDAQVLDRIPYNETRTYVKRVKENYGVYKNLYFKNT